VTVLPRSSFFDIAPKGLRAKPKLSITLEHVKSCLKDGGSGSGSGIGTQASSRSDEHEHEHEHTGLSNAPYFTAGLGQTLEILVRPASALVRVRPTREYAQFDIGHTETKRRAKRGRIREFSAKSRLSLQLLAADLQETVKKPDLMLTLTYPSDWRSVTTDWTCRCEASEGCSDVPCICDFSPSGKVCHTHIDTFQKRLRRYLKKHKITDWGALWFLEFQARGAPHFHLLLWGLGFSLFDLAACKKWLSESWAEIVSHPDPDEYQKHLKAGTRVEWMKKEHFGYALKYAAKMQQKTVPVEFANIGRFWGCWNNPLKKPVLRSIYTSSETLKKIAKPLMYLISDKSSAFFAIKVFNEFIGATKASRFSLRLFGKEPAEYLLSYGKPEPIALQC